MPIGKFISAPPVKWILSALFLALAAYFNFFLERDSFTELAIVYAGMFLLYLIFVQQRFWPFRGYMRWMMGLAILARLAALFAFPNLSDDIFRFIWDGRLVAQGIHPFEFTPTGWLHHLSGPAVNEWQDLYTRLNSPDYYSVYPPLNQLIYLLSVTLFPHSVAGAAFTIKTVVIASDLLLIGLLYKICLERHMSTMPVLLYALNPLVIIEFSGNLHFEGMMLLFLVLSIYLLHRNQHLLSALAFSGAILVKLHPVMLLPFFLIFLGWKKGSGFAVVSLSVSIGILLLFLAIGGNPGLRWEHFMESLTLYFKTFEFNGGIYYALRAAGSAYYGYNPIQKTGQLLFVLNLLVLLLLFIRQGKDWRDVVSSIAFAYFAYYILSTTVHPWYILTMLPFALLTGFRTPLVWTAVVIVSYFAYSTPDWHENFYLLALEYTCIFVFLTWEVVQARSLR